MSDLNEGSATRSADSRRILTATFVVSPSDNDPVGIRRVRALLKQVGRAHGLRCVDARLEELKQPSSEKTPG